MEQNTTCSAEGCQKDFKLVRGMCYAHYRQARRRGDFEKCKHNGCELGADRSGMCTAHYVRMLRGTDMDAPIRPHFKDQLSLSVKADNAPSVLQKVEARCQGDEGGCWIYPRVNGRGYGEMSVGGRVWLAHRLVAKFAIPEFSPECQVHHKCAVRRCCNPAHLQVVTPEENTAEMNERQFYLRRIKKLEEALSHHDPENPLLAGS